MAEIHKKAFYLLTLAELYELLRVRSEVFVVHWPCHHHRAWQGLWT